MPSKKFSLSEYFFEYPAVAMIVVANVFVYIFTHFFWRGVELLPQMILSPENLTSGHYTALVTTGFIHYDLSHLALNMLGAFVFGRIVEKHLGSWKFLFIYFGALAISMFFSIKFNAWFLGKDLAIIGASGAIMGLVGAAMLLDPFCVTFEMIIPMPVMVKGWLFFYADIQGLLNGQADGISHISHLLGFVSVGLLAYFLSKKDKKQMKEGLIANTVSLIIFFALWKLMIILKSNPAH